MAKHVLSYLIFIALMTVIITGSIIVVVFLYLPFVAVKAVVMGLTGKVSLRAEPATDG